MKEVLDDKFETQQLMEKDQVVLVDFYHKGNYDAEDQKRIRKILLKPNVESSIRSFITFLLLGLMIGGIGLSNGGADTSGGVAIGIGLTFLIIACWTVVDAIKMKQFLARHFAKIDKGYEEQGEYEIFMNETSFGSKDYVGKHQFNWTNTIHIKRKSDILFFYQWEDSNDPIFYLSKKALGDEEFETVLVSIENKIGRLKPVKNQVHPIV